MITELIKIFAELKRKISHRSYRRWYLTFIVNKIKIKTCTAISLGKVWRWRRRCSIKIVR